MLKPFCAEYKYARYQAYPRSRTYCLHNLTDP
jgi:hypothetical protein